jgi:PAS domain S-box-containing protein
MADTHWVELARTLFEGAGHALILFDPITERLREANPAAQRLSGLSAEELVGTTVSKLLRSDHPEGLQRLRLAFRQTGLFRAPEGFRLRTRDDGVWLPVDLTITRLHGEPEPLGLIAAGDVRGRGANGAALRASDAEYRTLLDTLTQSIFLKDQELRFIAANRPFCQVLGCSEADLIGKSDFDFYPPDLAEKYRADDRLVLSEGRHLELEEQTLIGGQLRTVQVVKTPVRDDQGQVRGVLGIFWDVTEQRQIDARLRQAHKMEAIGQLAGGIAHDFNNLLAAMLGNIELILSELSEGHRWSDMLTTAVNAGFRAAELTHQLLSFSRQTELRPEPANLNQSVEETVRFLRRTIDPRIIVQVRLEPNLWRVQADAAQMGQAVMNLCLNARDAMRFGGCLTLATANVTLDSEAARAHPDGWAGAFVRLTVEDTGKGMSAEVRERLFEPFFTTKPMGKGAGLGLAIVFGIVKQHGGWIECESQPNAGSRFHVYLPRLAAAASAPPCPPPRGVPGGAETILLADDEEMLRRLGREILERHGYRVLTVADGAEAVEVYRQRQHEIDLLILDLTMPRLSGLDALRQMRALNPAVPAIIASGYFTDKAVEAVERDGAAGWVAKPYRPADLAREVRAVLDRAGARKS